MIFILSLILNTAWSAPIDGYNCEITVIAKDLPPPGVASVKFVRPVDTHQSHGGTPFEFAAGANKIAVVADGKWRGLIWERSGKQIAQVLTAGTEIISGQQVMILYNPLDTDETVNLVCDPLKDIFPTE